MTNQLVTKDSNNFSWEDMIRLTTALRLYNDTLHLPWYLCRSSDRFAQVALATLRHLYCALLFSPHHDASNVFTHLNITSSNSLYMLLMSHTTSTSTYWTFDQCCILCTLHTFAHFCTFLRLLFVLLRLQSIIVPPLSQRGWHADQYQQATWPMHIYDIIGLYCTALAFTRPLLEPKAL